MDDLISLTAFSFRYPNSARDALCSISLAVKPGEFVVIAGGDESGKTTLCFALAGYCPQLVQGTCGGMVRLRRGDRAALNLREILEAAGMVMQNPRNQLSHTTATVREELAFTSENLGREPLQIREQIAKISTIMGITHLLERCPAELSGGEIQLVMIGAALIPEPSLLILDEPLSQLDPGTVTMLLRFLQDLTKQGKTVVLATNNLTATLECASRIMVLDQGSLLLDAPPALAIRHLLENDCGVVLPPGLILARKLNMLDWDDGSGIPVSSGQILERFRRWLRC